MADLINHLKNEFPNATVVHNGETRWVGGILDGDDPARRCGGFVRGMSCVVPEGIGLGHMGGSEGSKGGHRTSTVGVPGRGRNVGQAGCEFNMYRI